MSANITTVFQPTVTITVSDQELASLLAQNLVLTVNGGPPIVRPVLPADLQAELVRQIAVAIGNGGKAGLSFDATTGLYSVVGGTGNPIVSADASTGKLPAVVLSQLDTSYESLKGTAQPLRAALQNVARNLAGHDDSGTTPLQIVGLGSSVGVGATLPDPSTQAPVARFASQMGVRFSPLGNVPVLTTNGSVNGSTIAAGAQTDYAAAKTAAGRTPTIAVLAYGMNDGMPEQYHRGQTYTGFYSFGKQLVQAAQADGSDVVIFTTPHPRTDIMTDSFWALSGASIYPGSTAIPAATQASSVRSITLDTGETVPVSYRHLRVNQALRQIAAETGAVLVDVERYWFKAVAKYGLPALFNTGEYAHPNLLGHQQSYWLAIDDFARSYARSTVAAAPTPPPPAPITVFKPDNRAYTSTTTLSADPQLVAPVAAGRHYRVTVVAYYTGSTAGDMRIGLSLPSGATGSAGVEATGTNATTFGGDSATFRRVGLPDTYGLPVGCNGADAVARFTAVVHTGSTGGTLSAAFCQDTSNSSATTVYADSYMTVEQIG